MRIIGISIKDFCKVECVEAEFTEDGGLVPVASADNAQGKSSTLNAISWALGGPEAIPNGNDVVRDGADGAQVIVKFDEFTLKRTQKKGARQRLVVTGLAGGATQANLDTLWNRHTFDAGSFGDMSEKDQRNFLIRACGLEERLEQIDSDRKVAYDDRTDINRQTKAIKARLDALKEPGPFDPDEEVGATDVLNKIGLARERADWRRECERRREMAESDVLNASAEIEELEERLKDVREKLARFIATSVKAKQTVDALSPADDMEALTSELANVEATNKKIREARVWRDTHEQYVEALTQSKRGDDEIAAFDRQKKALLESVELPVEGLAIEDERLTLNGHPLTVASDAERIVLGAQIALALKPQIRAIRVQHGALLSAATRHALDKWAKDNKCLVFCELIRHEPFDDANEIWIEEGKKVDFAEFFSREENRD